MTPLSRTAVLAQREGTKQVKSLPTVRQRTVVARHRLELAALEVFKSARQENVEALRFALAEYDKAAALPEEEEQSNG